MKMRMKRIMGLFLALVMSIGCLSLNPIASYADDADPNTFNINQGSVNITQSGNYTITGTGQPTSNTISVTGNDITATITLNNVNIDIPNSDIQPAFRAKGYGQSNIHLTIKLKGTNSLKSSLTAGLYWTNSDDNSTDNSTLEIKGDGSLTATSRQYGAGIGGGNQCSGDNITITGGTVTATGGEAVGQGGGAAGIGGGSLGSGKNITITGGTVTATGGNNAAGIGGGKGGSGKNIKITGGTVKASSISTTPTDGKGHNVYLAKLENQNSVNEVTVDSGTGNKKTFKRAGSHPDGDAAFYLYLTGQDHSLVTSKGTYNAEWNSDTKTFTIMEFIKMEVKEQPKKLTYTEGDKLDLTGLSVTLDDGLHFRKVVPLADFGKYSITMDPDNGTVLKLGHSGNPVKLKSGSLTATTGALQVKQRVFDSTNVKSMKVTTQPTKLTYTENDKLDLTGLVVTLTDDHSLTKEVKPAEFGTYNISATPKNETKLTVADHNGKKVTLTKQGVQDVETDKLKVNSVPTPAPAPTLSPSAASASESAQTPASAPASAHVSAHAGVPAAPASVADLLPELKGMITIGANNVAVAGTVNRVTLSNQAFLDRLNRDGSAKAYAFIYSSPRLLKGAEGTDYVTVRMVNGKPQLDAMFPAGYSGKHTVVLVDEQGNQLGWTDITVKNGTATQGEGLPNSGVGIALIALTASVLAGAGATFRKIRR